MTGVFPFTTQPQPFNPNPTPNLNPNPNQITPQNLITNAANLVLTTTPQGLANQMQQNVFQGGSGNGMPVFGGQGQGVGQGNVGFGVGQQGFGQQGMGGNSFTATQQSTFPNPPTLTQNRPQFPNTAKPILPQKPKPFQPIKAKNPKLDAKHLVKCITALEENNNMSKTELRVKYILASQGGQGMGMGIGMGVGTGGFAVPTVATSSFGFGGLGGGVKDRFVGGVTNVGNQMQAPPSPQNPFNFSNTSSSHSGNSSIPGYGQANDPNIANTFNSPVKPVFGNISQAQPGTPFPFANNQPQLQFQTQPQVNNNAIPLGAGTGTGNIFNNNNGGQPNFGQGIFAGQAFTASHNMNANVTANPNANFNANANANFNTSFNVNNQGFNAGNNVFTSTSQQTAAFPNYNNNSYTNTNIMPTFAGNQNTAIFSNAAMSLAANILGPNISQASPTPIPNSNYFGGQPLLHPAQQPLNPLWTPFSSPEFLKLLFQKGYESGDRLAEEAKRRQPFHSRLFQFGDGEDEEKAYDGDRPRKAARFVEFYQKPFLFNEPSHSNFVSVNRLKLNQNQIKIKQLSKSGLRNQSILKTTPLIKFQQSYDKFHEKTLKEIIARQSDLPINDSAFLILPNTEKLSSLTPGELQRVSNVSIENDFGKVKFRKPISLYKKRLSQCIEIGQDSVEILDPDWEGVSCEICYKNFSKYKDAGEIERKKIERKMRRWADKNNMQITYIDTTNGNVFVQI